MENREWVGAGNGETIVGNCKGQILDSLVIPAQVGGAFQQPQGWSSILILLTSKMVPGLRRDDERRGSPLLPFPILHSRLPATQCPSA